MAKRANWERRAYTMLRLAQAGLHTFDHEAGRADAMHAAGMDDDAKRTVVLKLHDHPHVQQLLLQRCGISPRWLDGKRARPLLFDVRRDCYRQAFQPVAGGGLLVISSDRLIASAMTVWVFWGCIPHYLLGLVISAGFRTGVGL